MNKFLCISGLVLVHFCMGSIVVQAQRYLSDQFSDFEKISFPYDTMNGEELFLDIYRPKGDEETQRPAILYVHGGCFSGVSRDGKSLVTFAQDLAKRDM